MPHGTYCGGVASMINSYISKSETFAQYGVETELFDYEAPNIVEKMPSKISNIIYGFLQRRAILKKLRKEKNSQVHIHTSCQFLFLKDIWLAKAIKRQRNVPVFITVHVGAAETVFHRIGFAQKQTIRWINRYLDKVVFLGDNIREEFEQLGMLSYKGTTLGNFHNLEKISVDEELPKNAKLNLLFVGAIHRDKGIIELLTALSQLPNLDIHLDVCGQLTDSSIREDFEKLVRALGEKATLHGYVSGKEKTALFERADVLVLPSYHEGFPLVILEALASGTAIISTRVGATPEILNDENAYWVDIANSKQIEDGIIKMISDVTYLKNMQQANREKSKKFSIEEHIKTLCDIYKQF